MAEYSIYIDAAGSKKDNEQVRNINALFPYDSTKYSTISSLTRRDGIWCSAGGNSQSVDMEVYDQLLYGNTVIKTSDTATCKTYGRGPNLTSSGSSTNENYATTTFSNWTQKESNAAIAAWQAGTLTIKRFVTITDYTSSGHGSPVFRDGYYNDEITIKGQDVPFTNYGPSITVFDVFRSDDGKTENLESTTVYARIKLAMLNSAGLKADTKLLLYYEKEKNPTTASQFKNIKSAFGLSTTSGLNEENTIRLDGTWSNGASWRFMLYFSAGDEVAPAATDSASRARVPLFISDTNNGVAVGQYSSATDSQPKFESGWMAYFYDNPAKQNSVANVRDFNTKAEVGTASVQSGVSGIANIQTGTISGIPVDPETTVEVYGVLFPKPFLQSPLVVVGFAPSSGDASFGKCSCSVSSVSGSELAIRINYAGTSSDGKRTPSVNWIAVGIPK